VEYLRLWERISLEFDSDSIGFSTLKPDTV
jgi:hypothetical protein